MSVTIGQVYFSREKRPLFLEAGMPPGRIQRSYGRDDRQGDQGDHFGSIQAGFGHPREKKAVMDKGAEVLLEKRRSKERN